jgi:hypothetical protein
LLKTKVPEYQLQDAVAEYLRKQGYIVTHEIQFFTKRIDLFAVSRESLATMAVEVKIHNWKRALLQARAYLLCADYVYIALPSSLAQKVADRDTDNYSIGLLAVEAFGDSPLYWDVSIVIPATKSVLKRDEYMDRLRGAVLFTKFQRGQDSKNAG